MEQCRREWERLPQQNRFSADCALHAKAALDRLGRAISTGIDQTYQELQPKAEQLGRAFEADEWAVKLFAEEVVRGRPAFVLSLLLRHLDPILRRSAHLGDWQVISPSAAFGRIEVVKSLQEIQGRRFDQPTVVMADAVRGDEEPPEGVRAVITPSSVDLVSHVAVRARNAQLLFATCYNPAGFEQLKALQGRTVQLQVLPSGDVSIREAATPAAPVESTRAEARHAAMKPKPETRPIRSSDFASGLVGGKSLNLQKLRTHLPEWIGIPCSVALPFSTFDAVIQAQSNHRVAERFRELLSQVEKAPEQTLGEIRECVLKLEVPADLQSDLRRVMQTEGLAWPEDSSLVPARIKQVWASKWNERAYFSRRARGVSHESVYMAVLIQEVVEAEYAFVIHTVNPLSGARDELYAEVVAGLGETLVGNYPGRALSFISSKSKPAPTVLGYPSKSTGLYGSGLIFRSDSNAEDLAGYAGAGLYDSVLLQPPRETRLDYANDKLVWDEAFRKEFLQSITRIGAVAEKAFGTPQDIEGAFANGRYFVVQSRPQVGLG